MAKYHISPKTGAPASCRASKKPCPIGGESDHYTTKEEARAGYEAKMREQELPSNTKPSKSGKYSKETVDTWNELRSTKEAIDKYQGQADSLRRARPHFEKAHDNIEKAKETYQPAVHHENGSISYHGPSNEYAREALKSLERTKPWRPNAQDPWYPNSQYPDLKTVDEEISASMRDNERELQEVSGHIARLEAHRDTLQAKVVAETGYSENPRYGTPTGETTKQKWAGKQAGNYSTLPSKDVEVLENAESFCTKCGDSVTYDAKAYRHLHSNGESTCDKAKAEAYTGKKSEYTQIVSVNPKCRYCGTGDPAHSSFRQQSYSDEASCSRCGGVSGYGIGD